MKPAQTMPRRVLARSAPRGQAISMRGMASGPSKKYLNPTHSFDAPPSAAAQQSIAAFNEYMLPVYERPPFVLSHGKGSYVFDTEGRKYLDFSAGIAVNALGHADEGVLKVINEEAGKLMHASNVYHNAHAPALAETLVRTTQTEGGVGYARGGTRDATPSKIKVFFANSGAEANEGALKVARRYGKHLFAAANPTADLSSCNKTRIACFEGSFHGRTMGALSVTTNAKYQAPFTPLIPGVDVGKLNDVEGIERLVTPETCGVIVEPIQGEGGINPASEAFLRRLRERCDEVGAVLIFDEIQRWRLCGLFRTGNMWAHSHLPVECHPDIVTMAKPLANGFPIGAFMVKNEIAAPMSAGTHGTTFGGSPLACAIGNHVVQRLAQPSFVKGICETAAHLDARLAALPGWFPDVLQPGVRGRGLIRGLGFKDGAMPGKVAGLARERGVFVLTAGKDAVRLVPSLNVGRDEVDLAMDVLESCLSTL
ncbi:hypothetical protein D9619_000988 [Psilocybe cf. subviscida]|uniref:Acetylornithine transaminase n=1 Tax=Psilocybe cf. subviscida TaxID=2480587 RepID=A0A8H5F3N8_9AGAR|nr:hypothetical protein D9619_000988 [Psilocybe cf. subviscida]